MNCRVPGPGELGLQPSPQDTPKQTGNSHALQGRREVQRAPGLRSSRAR